MFNRAELKYNAKKIFMKNYWMCVVVTLILSIVGGAGIGVSVNYFLSDNSSQYATTYDGSIGINNGVIDKYGNVYQGVQNGNEIEEGVILDFYNRYNYIYNRINNMMNNIPPAIRIVILYAVITMFILSMLLGIFVFNPLQVGCRRWFIQNRKNKPEMSEITYIFSHGYMNTVKVMFSKSLFIFLWSLLFVIPGIIKNYEYRMVPFLLAENPNMDMNEVFERSKKLMHGNKWEAFVLDISFFGWAILASMTYGILNIFYVWPYIETTNTELYVCLCQGRDKYTAENGRNSNPYGNPYENPNGNNSNNIN